nr:AAA family ATPase [Actinomycetota bacterium]
MVQQKTSSDAGTEEALRKLRERLDWKIREIVEGSGIDPEVALERDYYLEKTKIGLQRLGFTRNQQRPSAIVIPRFSPSGEEIPPQIKPDSPRLVENPGKLREIKYEYPPNTPVRLSVHPRSVKMMRDKRYPLWITEGDKKGDALVSRGAVAVVLQGVDCWNVPQDWEDVKLHGRECIIAFDADVMVNPNVQRALTALAAFLRSRGAKVKYLNWPEKYRGTKTGVDDALAARETTIREMHGWAGDAPDEEAIPVGTWMSDIEPERVEWLWDRRIPLGKVTMLDGDPGRGKSTILYDLAARVTVGKDLPDGQPLEKGGVLIVSMEDGAADTILPRFLAAGGDPTRAKIIGAGTPLVIPDDVDKLERAIRETGARLVVIDPVMGFLADNVNTNSDQQVRRALQPLVDLAERTGPAITLCRHLNKGGGGGETIYRGQGSIGFIGIARSGLMVGEHPEREGVMVLAGAKGNLSEKPDSLAYRIKGAATADGIPTASIEYLGRTEVTASQMNTIPQDEGERDRLTEAREFLRDVLRAGPVWGKQIKREANEADIAYRTVERAKSDLKVQTYKDGESGKWMWVLSAPPEDGDEDRRSSPRHSDGGGVGGVGGHGGHGPSSPTPPTMADMADMPTPPPPTTTNKAYIRELRQLRQLRHDPLTTDEATTPPTPPTPPTNSANDGGHDEHPAHVYLKESRYYPTKGPGSSD